MSKVTIITRTYNRLEYTVLCLRSIYDKSGFDDYTHIIVEQGSTDGTREWLKSLLKEKYYKLKVVFNTVNSGDAGGMLDGYKQIDDDCKYVMQFDNDCQAIDNNFLKKLVYDMDNNTDIGIIMMKREGVTNSIRYVKKEKINEDIYGTIDKATCCMIIRRETLDEINTWVTGEKIGWGFLISSKIKKKGFRLLKSITNRVDHIDTTSGQIKKYPKYFNSKLKNTNYRKIDYNKI